MKHLTRTEVERLLKAAETTHVVRDQAMLTTMLYRGLRASEPRLIRRQDVDLLQNTIWIRRLKGSDPGLYDMTMQERDALELWLQDPKCNKHPEGHIFPISGRQVYNIFQRYAKAAGLPDEKCHPHVLKHTIAVRMIEQGFTPADVQDWLGHRSLNSVAIYARVSNERRRANAARFKA